MTFRQRTAHFIESPRVGRFIMVLILINAIVLVLKHRKRPRPPLVP